MLFHNDLFTPEFDLGDFRNAVARYVKLLIRARWKCEPNFLSKTDLAAWGLSDVAVDRWTPQALMQQAASALANLNMSFLPRCGSGGVKETDDTTPVGRLIWDITNLVPSEGGGPHHNGALVAAAKTLAEGKNIDWNTLVVWSALPGIRADLDLLPHPKKKNVEAVLDTIELQLATLVDREKMRDWYTTEQFAKAVGKAEFTVRAWCRTGRIKAQKRASGRGAHPAWVVSHDEMLRYQREGLLPVSRCNS